MWVDYHKLNFFELQIFADLSESLGRVAPFAIVELDGVVLFPDEVLDRPQVVVRVQTLLVAQNLDLVVGRLK